MTVFEKIYIVNNSITNKILTYKYMKDFKCTAADCVDSCCTYWHVNYDKKHYLLLRDVMHSDSTERVLFDKSISLTNQSDSKFASIEKIDGKNCSFLQGDQLCHLHNSYGQKYLSNTCAQYPRVFMQHDSVIEMHGTLSCPEVARLYLQSKENFDEVSVSEDMLPRGYDIHISNSVISDLDSYQKHFSTVRSMMLEIIDDIHLPLDLKLYILASSTNELSSIYFRGCEDPGEEKIVDIFTRMSSKKSVNSLRVQLGNYLESEPFMIMLIQAIILLRQKHVPDDNFGKLVTSILNSYNDEIDESAKVSNDIAIFEPHDLWIAYKRRHNQVYITLGTQIDRFLLRYLRNCISREWFTNMPQPFIYTQMLITRLAMLKFMLVSDPQTLELSSEENNFQALEALAVKHVYSYARAIDQDTGFLQSIYQVLEEQKLFDIEFTPMFIG